MTNVWPRSTGNVLNRSVSGGELTLRAMRKAICTDFSEFGSVMGWSAGANGTKVRGTCVWTPASHYLIVPSQRMRRGWRVVTRVVVKMCSVA